MQDNVFVKTEAGLDEIQTRTLRLSPRLRSLLVLVDGKHSAVSLLEMVRAIGVTADDLQQLLDKGLIGHTDRYNVMAYAQSSAVPASAGRPELRPAEPLDDKQKLAAMYEFFNGFIRPTFGLRGLMLQLKLERCSTIDDYRDLTTEVLTSLETSHGDVAVSQLMTRIEAIMGSVEGW